MPPLTTGVVAVLFIAAAIALLWALAPTRRATRTAEGWVTAAPSGSKQPVGPRPMTGFVNDPGGRFTTTPPPVQQTPPVPPAQPIVAARLPRATTVAPVLVATPQPRQVRDDYVPPVVADPVLLLDELDQ